MKRSASSLWESLFPPVGRKAALCIAAEACRPGSMEIRSGLPPNAWFYSTSTEPFWCIRVPRNDGRDGTMLRSSRIILVSKQTGKILYDGSAHDEG